MPPVAGTRITFPGGKPSVADGPWPDSKDVVGGYWIIQVGSKEEAVEWAKRVPCNEGDMIEVRQIFEVTDFPEDVQAAADSPVLREQLQKVKV